MSRLRRAVPAHRLLLVAPLAAIVLGLAAVGTLARVPDDQIAPGVRVAEVALGGKTQAEARQLLEQWAGSQQNVAIKLRFPQNAGVSKSWKQMAGHLGLTVDIPATLDAAMRAGRSGVLGQVSQWVHGAETTQIPASVRVDDGILSAYLKQVAWSVNHPARNAQLLASGRGYVVKSEKSGLSMDVAASQVSVAQAWNQLFAPKNGSAPVNASPAGTAPPASTPPATESGEKPATDSGTQTSERSSAPADAIEVLLTAKITPAAVTREDLKQIDLSTPLGSFSTSVGGTSDRNHNVTLAASHINGKLLRPGEIFSYNETVGQRRLDNGFRKAHEIVHGELRDGVGGGICQVSSTLFNAVLQTELRVVSRSNHAFPIGYVPTGRDATVDWGNIDFRFQNTTDAPLYLTGANRRRRLTFHIYGKHKAGLEVQVERGPQSSRPAPPGHILTDPTLPAGRHVVKEKPHPDIRVTWYRVVKQDGQVVRRDPFYTHYRGLGGTVLVGTRPRPVRIPVRASAPATAGTPAANAPATPPPADNAPPTG